MLRYSRGPAPRESRMDRASTSAGESSAFPGSVNAMPRAGRSRGGLLLALGLAGGLALFVSIKTCTSHHGQQVAVASGDVRLAIYAMPDLKLIKEFPQAFDCQTSLQRDAAYPISASRTESYSSEPHYIQRSYTGPSLRHSIRLYRR